MDSQTVEASLVLHTTLKAKRIRRTRYKNSIFIFRLPSLSKGFAVLCNLTKINSGKMTKQTAGSLA